MYTKERKREVNQAYRKTPHGAATCAWNRLTSRVGAKYGHRECYRHVEVRMTREEFMAWAVPEYEMWFFLYPGLQPSLDRINPEGHYEVSNLRLIPNYLNKLSTRKNKNLKAPPGTSWCCDCEKFLPLDQFHKNSQSRITGVRCRCKDCHRQKVFCA